MLLKRQEVNTDKDVEKREPLCTVGGNVSWVAAIKNNIDVPQKIKNGITIWSNTSTSRYISKGNEITYLKRYMHHIFFVAALPMIAKIWKNPKNPLMDE